MSSFSPDSKSRVGRGDQNLIKNCLCLLAFWFVLDFRYIYVDVNFVVDVNSDVGVSVDINVDTSQEARAACFQL